MKFIIIDKLGVVSGARHCFEIWSPPKSHACSSYQNPSSEPPDCVSLVLKEVQSVCEAIPKRRCGVPVGVRGWVIRKEQAKRHIKHRLHLSRIELEL